MELTCGVVRAAGLAGRGGSSMTPVGGSLYVFGGADRTGGLYSDMAVLQRVAATAAGPRNDDDDDDDDAGEEEAAGGPSSSADPAARLRLRLVHGTGEGRDCRSGLPIPSAGGHAATALTLGGGAGRGGASAGEGESATGEGVGAGAGAGTGACSARSSATSTRIVAFGGIDFAAAEVISGLYEFTPGSDAAEVVGGGGGGAKGPRSRGGRWRALGGPPAKDKGGQRGQAQPAAGPRIGEPRLVGGAVLPGGRTGHTLSAVPPPVVLDPEEADDDADHAGAGAGGSAGRAGESSGCGGAPAAPAAPSPFPHVLPLWAVPGYAGPVPAARAPFGPAAAEVGRDERCALAFMFGGSTPDEGPLNDVWLLRASAPESSRGRGGESAGEEEEDEEEWAYEWTEVDCGASSSFPSPRELHVAWVRPAIVQRVLPATRTQSAVKSGGGGGGGGGGGLGGGGDGDGDGSKGGSGGGSAAAAAGSGAEGAELEAGTLVRVLQPAALCVYGGRGADDPAPRSDLCVLAIHSSLSGPPPGKAAASSSGNPQSPRSDSESESGSGLGSVGAGGAARVSCRWLAPVRVKEAGGHAAAAGTPARGGLAHLSYGGLGGDGDLSLDLWVCDTAPAAMPPAAMPVRAAGSPRAATDAVLRAQSRAIAAAQAARAKKGTGAGVGGLGGLGGGLGGGVGGLGGAAEEEAAPSLDPSSWQWRCVVLLRGPQEAPPPPPPRAAGSGGGAVEPELEELEGEPMPPRFAACAAVVPSSASASSRSSSRSKGLGGAQATPRPCDESFATMAIFGGMTALEDMADVVVARVPVR